MAERAALEDQRPWREGQDVALQELKETLANYTPVQLTNDPVSAINVLLMGPVGSGKSSFVNTIYSAFQGTVTSLASAGSTRTRQSYTPGYQRYDVNDPASGHPMKFRLCDTKGLDDSSLCDLFGGCRGLTFGKLVPRGRFWGTAMDDKVHCLVIVLDSCTLDSTTETMWQKIRNFLSRTKELDVPQAVLLTKVDQLDPRVGADVSLVFRSPAVEDAVSKAARLVGVPRAHVLPVKNYESEGRLVPELDKLALLSLRSMLRLTDGAFHNLQRQNPRSAPQRPNQAFVEWAVIGIIIGMVGLFVAAKYVDHS